LVPRHYIDVGQVTAGSGAPRGCLPKGLKKKLVPEKEDTSQALHGKTKKHIGVKVPDTDSSVT